MSKKSGGDLATVAAPDHRFLAIHGDEDFKEAMAANLSTGETIRVSDLIRVKTPAGGGRTWQYTNSDGVEVEEKSITGLLVYYAPVGQLWGSDNPTKGARPVLTSYDLKTAVRTNDDLGDIDAEQLAAFRIGDRLYDWEAMGREGSPFGWGSGKGGMGRRIKEARVLAILQPGEAWPVLINAGAGSLATVCPWVKRLKVAHFRVVVSLTLNKAVSKGGIDYSQIIPELVGTISREEGLVIKRLYTDPLTRLATQFDVQQDAA
jgi:hypothetical protein